MPLNFGDQTAFDKLNRCKQEAAFLDQAVNTDGFIRFADYAWHLCDWIIQDPSIPKAAKDDVSAWRRNPPSIELAICKDIINYDKHMRITYYAPTTTDATSERGFGVGRYGKGGYGVGEESITVTLDDGRVFNALEVVQAVLTFWDDFFKRHGISGQPESFPKDFRGPEIH